MCQVRLKLFIVVIMLAMFAKLICQVRLKLWRWHSQHKQSKDGSMHVANLVGTGDLLVRTT
jgi:hypothetical protein